MTRGGARHVLECVGATSSIQQAIELVRPGGHIGYVGVPHGPAKSGLDIILIAFAPSSRMDWLSRGTTSALLGVLSWVAPLMVLHLRYRAETEELDPHEPASF